MSGNAVFNPGQASVTVPGQEPAAVLGIQGSTDGIPLKVAVVSGGGSGGGNVNLTQVGGAAFALGQANEANSLPVTLASDQGPVPITTDGAAATGVAQDAGGTGAIGWLSSAVKNLRLILAALQSTLAVAVSNFPSSFAVSNFPGTQPVSGNVAVSNFPTTQPVSNAFTTNQAGTWSYYSGANGTVAVTGRVIGVTAYSANGGTITVNGGATITLPAGATFSDQPLGTLVSPTYVFGTGISFYFVEVLN